MKLITLFTLANLSYASASTLQYIDCSFHDGDGRLVINLHESKKAGTLFYSTGYDPMGEEGHTPILPLKLETKSSTEVSKTYRTLWNRQNGESIEFKFEIPESNIFVKSNYFNAALSSNGSRFELSCFSYLMSRN